MSITQDRLREILNYDSETGVFTWAKSRPRVRVGNVAGHDHNGYTRIELDGRAYRAHRLAWLYVNGSFPSGEIDHINGDRKDNSISNLRIVSHAENCQNKRKARFDSETGLIGIAKNGNKYRAEITTNGNWIYLGNFDTPEEAHAAYKSAKQIYHGVSI